jgi:hypothetical protein
MKSLNPGGIELSTLCLTRLAAADIESPKGPEASTFDEAPYSNNLRLGCVSILVMLLFILHEVVQDASRLGQFFKQYRMTPNFCFLYFHRPFAARFGLWTDTSL